MLDPIPELQFQPAEYPRSKILYLPAIKERVPVFEGTFRISQDLKVSTAGVQQALGANGKDRNDFGKA